MLILLILLLLVPAIISVFLYERFRGKELSIQNRVILFLILAFLINMIGYAALWFRGQEHVSWALSGTSTMTSVSFCIKYMALSLVSAVIIPFVLYFIRKEKRNMPESDAEVTIGGGTEDAEQAADITPAPNRKDSESSTVDSDS